MNEHAETLRLRGSEPCDGAAVEMLWYAARSRVTFTAPHAQPTRRDGAHKPRELCVGDLALEASRRSESNALVPLTAGCLDGNWHEESVFRKKLWSLLPPQSVLLDLHGMGDDHGVDLVYGTAGGATPAWLLDAALDAAASMRVSVRHDGPLSASPRTITASACVAGHAALQIEVAAKWRSAPPTTPTATAILDVLVRLARFAGAHGNA